MLLDILIPTYNRQQELKKNVLLLIDAISQLHLEDQVQLMISDNCSTDGTTGVISQIQKNTTVRCMLFMQKENIGLEKNAVFLLAKSTSQFVMFLGDDDYLQIKYLDKVVDYLTKGDITCIIPSFLAKTSEGQVVGARSLGKMKNYKKGPQSVYESALLGHQLSGLTFLRENTLDKYLENEHYRNIYLWIFFVGYNCLRGNSVHLTEYPVDVTVGEKKDWNYGQDALFNEKIKNIPLLYPSGWNRFMLEYKFYISNIYSINTIYPSRTKKLKALYLSSVSKNLSLPFKAYLPIALCLFGISKICKFIGDR